MEENVIEINSGITKNVDVVVKNVMYIKKIIFGTLYVVGTLYVAISSCENGNYFPSVLDDSAITCDEIIEPRNEGTKPIPTNFSKKKATCKSQNFYILLAFLLITLALLIVVSIYCYLIRY